MAVAVLSIPRVLLVHEFGVVVEWTSLAHSDDVGMSA
jgi:hypothetical protein